MKLVIEGLKLRSLANMRGHWSVIAKHKKRVQCEVIYAIHAAGLANAEPLAKATVTVTRVGPRALDIDNLYSSIKSCVDALKGRLIEDDAPDKCKIVAEQRKGEYQVEIDVSEMV